FSGPLVPMFDALGVLCGALMIGPGTSARPCRLEKAQPGDLDVGWPRRRSFEKPVFVVSRASCKMWLAAKLRQTQTSTRRLADTSLTAEALSPTHRPPSSRRFVTAATALLWR